MTTKIRFAPVIFLLLLLSTGINISAWCQLPSGRQDGDRPVSAAGSLPVEEASAGWIRLFDGLTSAGWLSTPPVKPWKISNSEFVSIPGSRVTTLAQFSEYELQFEYMLGAESSAQFLGGLDGSENSANTCYALTLSNSNGVNSPWRRITLRTVPGGFAVFSLDSELQVARPHRAETGSLGFLPIKGSFRVRRMRLRPTANLRPSLTDRRSQITPVPADFRGFQPGENGNITLNASGGNLQFPAPSSSFVFQADMLIVDGYGRLHAQFGSDPNYAFSIALDNRCIGIDHTRPLNTGTGGFIDGQKTREVVADNGQPFTLTVVSWQGGAAVYVNGYFTANRIVRTSPINTSSLLSFSADTLKANIKFRNLRVSMPQVGQNGKIQ